LNYFDNNDVPQILEGSINDYHPQPIQALSVPPIALCSFTLYMMQQPTEATFLSLLQPRVMQA
jgi:hypothetical protein